MPTAIEYGLITTKQWHTQNGAGSGPPAQNVLIAQNGAGSGPPAKHQVIQPDVPPAMPADEWLLAGPLAALLLITAVAAAIRRRSAPSRGRGVRT